MCLTYGGGYAIIKKAYKISEFNFKFLESYLHTSNDSPEPMVLAVSQSPITLPTIYLESSNCLSFNDNSFCRLKFVALLWSKLIPFLSFSL